MQLQLSQHESGGTASLPARRRWILTIRAMHINAHPGSIARSNVPPQIAQGEEKARFYTSLLLPPIQRSRMTPQCNGSEHLLAPQTRYGLDGQHKLPEGRMELVYMGKSTRSSARLYFPTEMTITTTTTASSSPHSLQFGGVLLQLLFRLFAYRWGGLRTAAVGASAESPPARDMCWGGSEKLSSVVPRFV